MNISDRYAELNQFCQERGWLLNAIRIGRLVRSRDLAFKRARLQLVESKIVELVGEIETTEVADGGQHECRK